MFCTYFKFRKQTIDMESKLGKKIKIKIDFFFFKEVANVCIACAAFAYFMTLHDTLCAKQPENMQGSTVHIYIADGNC